MNRRLIVMLLSASLALAQQGRLGVPRDQRTVVLKGNLNPKAAAGDDRGLVEDDHRITGMTFVLKQSPAQQAAFAQLLHDQQTPGSPDYRNWITPEQYAGRFGLSLADFASMAAWLKAQGFSVDYQARGRNWILFSGTSRQVSSAFHTSMHYFQVDGQLHFSAIGEPSIPATLEPFVLAVRGLDDFRLSPPNRTFKALPGPDYNSGNGTHNLAPGDLGVIYDINKLYSQNVNGSGQKLVVVGQTDIYLTDVQSFRSMFGLPVNDPVLVLVPGSADPGYTGDLDEANLDLDWSGAVARNASINYVYSQNVVTSLEYAIDQNIAPVISMSYGGCELKISSTPASTASAYRTLAQQANSEGITFMAASGDSGSASCDNSGAVSASGGLSVNMPASIPEVTAVGGTTFNEGVVNYWSSSAGVNGVTATANIPEDAWNDTAERNGLSASDGGVRVAVGGYSSLATKISITPQPDY
jgi:subtilase family serine protease